MNSWIQILLMIAAIVGVILLNSAWNDSQAQSCAEKHGTFYRNDNSAARSFCAFK